MIESSGGRSLALDGVRGLALLIVVIHNTAWIGGPSEQLAMKVYRAGSASGWVGVQLFFVLSGLLITNILVNTRASTDYFRQFYVRRALRIFPLYYVAIGVLVFVAAPLAWSSVWAESVYRHQWAFWLYASNWTEPLVGGVLGLSHLWSLAIEEQFYLVWPAMVWWLAPRRLIWLVVGILIAAPFVRFAILVNGLPPQAAYTFTIARIDALAIGALLALFLRDTTLRGQLRRWLPAATLAGAALLGVLVARTRGFHAEEVPVLIYGQSLAALLSFCLIAWTQFLDTPQGARVSRVLSSHALRNLGKYSYAMYIVHAPIHVLLRDQLTPLVQIDDTFWHLPRLLAYTVLVLGLSYAAARISWIVIEQPALRLKERWAPVSEARQDAFTGL